MARQVIEIIIQDEGNDFGKSFFIRRMSAWDADRWARRVIFALLQTRTEIEGLDPEEGIAGLTRLGLQLMVYIEPDVADTLLETLLACVFRRPDAQNPAVEMRLMPGDVESVQTIATLREAAFNLHTDFFSGVVRLFSPAGKEAGAQNGRTAPTSSAP